MKRGSSLLAIALPPIGALVSGLAAWSIVVRVFHVQAFLLPPPEQVLAAARASSHELAIALVRVRADLPMRCARLRRTIRSTFGTQIRMARLPGLLPEALRLVDELAR